MIKLSSDTITSGGANGIYWRYDKNTGIKISLASDYATRREGRWLKKLNKLVPGLFPEFKGFMKVIFDGEKSLCFKMEHIEGERAFLEDLKLNQRKSIVTKLRKAKIIFEDINGNVLIQNEKIRLIDADPNYFFWKGKRL